MTTDNRCECGCWNAEITVRLADSIQALLDSAQKQERRVVTCSQSEDEQAVHRTVYCEDGTVWEKSSGEQWSQTDSIPPAGEKPQEQRRVVDTPRAITMSASFIDNDGKASQTEVSIFADGTIYSCGLDGVWKKYIPQPTEGGGQ